MKERELPPLGVPLDFTWVEPVFRANCALCHRDGGLVGEAAAGLDLTTYDGVMRSSERPVVVAQVPGASELYRRVVGHSRPRMPRGKAALAAKDVEIIARWIRDGARNAVGRPAPIPVACKSG